MTGTAKHWPQLGRTMKAQSLRPEHRPVAPVSSALAPPITPDFRKTRPSAGDHRLSEVDPSLSVDGTFPCPRAVRPAASRGSAVLSYRFYPVTASTIRLRLRACSMNRPPSICVARARVTCRAKLTS